MVQVTIPYGNRQLPISFGDGVDVTVRDISKTTPVESSVAEIRRALLNPIGTSRLADFAKGKRTAAIAISDFSRPTFDREILPQLLDELNLGGIVDSNICVIIGGGLHARMKINEVHEKVGPAVRSRVRVVQHDADRDAIPIGFSRFGNEIQINSTMVQADIKIATGDIVPHPYAGFSGGGKAVMPGLAGRSTVLKNHLMVKAELNIGQINNNPVREEIDEAAKLLHLDFIVNTIQNADRGLVRVVAGHPIEAHRAGAGVSASVYAVPVKEKPDLIVASAFPYDRDFYYCSKPLENTGSIVKDGSTLILVSPCRGGIGSEDLEYFLSKPSPETILESIKQNPKRNLVTAIVAYQVACLRSRANIIAYTEGLKPSTLRMIGLKSSTNLQKTIDETVAERGAGAKVLVLPHGSTAMPVLNSQQSDS
jgi:nickel-dependent lactate racemase